jgi:hypothetical protein
MKEKKTILKIELKDPKNIDLLDFYVRNIIKENKIDCKIVTETKIEYSGRDLPEATNEEFLQWYYDRYCSETGPDGNRESGELALVYEKYFSEETGKSLPVKYRTLSEPEEKE